MLAPLLLLTAFSSSLGAPAKTDAGTLARALAERSGGNAIVLLTDGRTVDADATVKGVEAYMEPVKDSGVRYVPAPSEGGVAVAYAATLPDGPMYRVAKLTKAAPSKSPKAVEIPKEALKGGKITFSTEPGARTDLLSLQRLGWSVPLALSPAFTDALAPGEDLAITVKDLDEVEFLRALAKALGGRFGQTTKGYRIEPIGAELKTRALATIARARKNPAATGAAEMGSFDVSEGSDATYEVAVASSGEPQRGFPKKDGPAPNAATIPARLDFARALTQAVPPADFEKFLARDLDPIRVDLGGNAALQAAVVNVIKAEAGDPAAVARAQALVDSVNPQNPGYVRLEFGYGIGAVLNAIDRRGRAIRTLNLRIL